ncbi:MAG: diguanylate cyclase [Candidatus Hydrogenedentes bacterium]|nr:diguanylate cyclase [Candidatus Hydrogenedentota bacterium]
MLNIITYSVLAFGIAMLLGSFWLLRRSMAGPAPPQAAPLPARKPLPAPASASVALVHAPVVEASLSEDELLALQRSRELMHGLLAGVSQNVRNLLGEMDAYTGSLKRHETSVKQAQTLAALEEVERLLLAGISDMQSASETYRDKLHGANKTIAEQRTELDRLSEEASIDFLTRVANRRTLDKRLVEELNRAGRENRPFSVVLFDLDHFKAINDTHGHLCGDEILRIAAQILSTHCREYDFLARYGGEEFALMLPGAALKEAGAVAEKMRLQLAAAPLKALQATLSVTLSAGVSEVRPGNDTIAALIGRADQALYKAKSTGRNRVILQA